MRLLLILISFLPFGWVKNRYLAAGGEVGDAESYSFIGEPLGMEFPMWRWRLWEEAIIRRGYQTYSLDQFIDYGGWNFELPQLRLLEDKEDPVKHAVRWKQKLKSLGRQPPNIEYNSDGSFSGEYTNPSTESE
jgi:hypothetical protein